MSDDLKPIAASLQPLINSSNGSLPSTNLRQTKKEKDAFAAERARLLFGQFRKGDANDPQTYVASIAATLAQYPPDVIKLATDPRTGLAAQSEWLPNVKEMRDFCEGVMASRESRKKREQQVEAQLTARQYYEEKRAKAPTREELKAKGLFRDKEKAPALPADKLYEMVQRYMAQHPGQIVLAPETRQILEAAGYKV
jgi:hypothetical protein